MIELTMASEMTASSAQRDPAVWTATEMNKRNNEWTYHLTDADITEIDTALRSQNDQKAIQVSARLDHTERAAAATTGAC